jgi:hypothetical protein
MGWVAEKGHRTVYSTEAAASTHGAMFELDQKYLIEVL